MAMNNHFLERTTVITTIDLKYRPIQLLRRFSYFVNYFSKITLNLVIVHCNRNSISDKILTKITIAAKNIKIVHVSHRGDICNSRLRNIGVAHAKTENIIFCDLDIYPEINTFYYMIVNSIHSELCILPCIYLSKKGTNIFTKYKNKSIVDKWLNEWDLNKLLHIALPSSLLCTSKELFMSINGFDENFIGYGYEDFDFMIRAALKKGQINNGGNLLIDKTYTTPLFSYGFRAELAKLSLPHYLNFQYGVHLFHSKKNIQYYNLKKYNKTLFQKKFEKLIDIDLQQEAYSLVKIFIQECQHNKIDFESVSILFCKNPSNIVKKWR